MENTVQGVLVMLLATSMTNVGAVVQKRGVDRLPPFDQQPVWDSVKAVLRTPLWVFGWLLGVAGIVLNMVALGLADISVIQPLNGFGLVVLAVFSRFYLGERLHPSTIAGIGAVIAGVVVVGATVPPSRVFTAPAEILACYTHPAALSTLAGLGVGIAATFALARRVAPIAGILFALVAAACSVTGLTFSKGFFGLLTVAGLGGTLGMPPAWGLLAMLLTLSILAMMVQQLSFQKGRAVVVTPVFAATSVLLPLLPGALVFGEQLAGTVLLAPVFIVSGVVLLGLRQPGSARPSEQPIH